MEESVRVDTRGILDTIYYKACQIRRKMIRLKIMCLFLCAFTFNTAWAYVLVKCDLTEAGKHLLKVNIQNNYGCSLSADHNYVLHGSGDDFSSAWNSAVETCSRYYTFSDDYCSAMISSCSVASESYSYYGDYPVIGTCECLAPPSEAEQTGGNINTSICTQFKTYHKEHPSVTSFFLHANRHCGVKVDTAGKTINIPGFPINCNFSLKK